MVTILGERFVPDCMYQEYPPRRRIEKLRKMYCAPWFVKFKNGKELHSTRYKTKTPQTQ
jgi:hypothetical protein